MNNRYIEELHKIREKNYEETKDVSFEKKQEQIHQSAMEFMKLVEHARQERMRA